MELQLTEADGEDPGARSSAAETLAAAACALLPDGVDPAPFAAAFGVPVELSPLPEAVRAKIGGGPRALGELHEDLRDDRRASGAVYTPRALARELAQRGLEGLRGHGTGIVVCDPSVGGGSFLLEVADLLLAQGVPASEIVARRLWGCDVDELAIATTRVSLALWSLAADGEATWPPDDHIVVGDPLAPGVDLFPAARPGFDLVIGNPPFQGQLKSGTVRQRPVAGPAGRRRVGYADTAALFLLVGCGLARPGGRVVLIQPQSVLTARDSGPVRTALSADAELIGLWVSADHEFDAAVRVWAPILETRASGRGRARAPVRRWQGVDFRPAPDATPPAPGNGSWAPLVADLLGALPLDVEWEARWQGRLGERATATAGFRDQFYGLAPFVAEDHELGAEVPQDRRPPLLTVGLIDPLLCGWGTRPARFAKRNWDLPVVDLAALREADPRLGAWVDARLRPKVVVATQTPVVEAIADPRGRFVPSTPAISVEVDDPESVHAICAVLCSPPISAWMFGRRAGSGLSSSGLRISAADVAEVPLPADAEAWARGAALAAEAQGAADDEDDERWSRCLAELARVMTEAYGLPADHPVVAWWEARRPHWR